MKLLPLVLAASVTAAPAATATSPATQDKASQQTKATFVEKCFRDRTKESCTAPPEARVRK